MDGYCLGKQNQGEVSELFPPSSQAFFLSGSPQPLDYADLIRVFRSEARSGDPSFPLPPLLFLKVETGDPPCAGAHPPIMQSAFFLFFSPFLRDVPS